MATFVSDDPTADLRDVAGRLGLDDKLMRNGKGKLATRTRAGTDDQQTLTGFDSSGGFFYRYDHRLHAVPEEQPRLPEAEKAFVIATEYLLKHGLLPDDALAKPDLVSFHQPMLSEFEAKSGRILQSFATSIEVRYPQQWGDLPVTGPGSKLYVALGDGGDVVGVTRMWRSARPTNVMLKTVPAEEAFRQLKVGSHLSMPVGCATAKIEQFQLAYWSESPKESQRTSLPLYQIQGQCVSETGEGLGGFMGYAPAVHAGDFKLNDAPREADDVDDEEG
ncbi:hypothetical protein GCM10022278_01730 [Allohahella marinimesophila]|uniref:Uncharacterized protein n=2 Tax=Allohahella marinimesophila TaxID=1054972 RepID=A0ABP7NG82_9GAMM